MSVPTAIRADEILVWNIIGTNCAFGIRNSEIKSHKNQAIEMIRIADPAIRLSVARPSIGLWSFCVLENILSDGSEYLWCNQC
jgi:hypothetical protein